MRQSEKAHSRSLPRVTRGACKLSSKFFHEDWRAVSLCPRTAFEYTLAAQNQIRRQAITHFCLPAARDRIGFGLTVRSF
jgi:hypothetical protein